MSGPGVRPAPDEPSAARRAPGALVLRGVTVIDGTGAPPYGPATVRIQDGRITDIVSGRTTITDVAGTEATTAGDPAQVTELDVSGTWLLPGLIDAHAHIGGPDQVAEAEYVYKLWLANGITTVREAGALQIGLDFVASEAARSSAGQIVAPTLVPYVVFGQGSATPLTDLKQISAWMRDAAGRGARGVKFFGAPPTVLRIAIEEASVAGLRTMCHHAQSDAGRVNALTTARWGLTSLEHGYGLAEAMLVGSRLPGYPAGYNYDDEHDRFAGLGRIWDQAAAPGSGPWTALIDELVELDLTLVPTFVAHLASRDLEHARGRRYHRDYTTARLQRFFTPGAGHHGSFFADWGSVEESAWRKNYRLWMSFVRDFHLRGGRVCAGSDAGFIYNTFGFGLIEELELFCEAGFSPLEAISAVTLHAAELLGRDDEIGSIEVGKRADLVVMEENPLANLKLLSAAGHLRYAPGGAEQVAGTPRWTITGGVVHDARQLAAQVRTLVDRERAASVVPQER